MSYLIDGNNLMGRSGSRRGLLDELAGFVARKRVQLSVVFDGAPEDFFPDGAKYRGVKVFYAVRGRDADERIKAMVEGERERRTLYVVTSDLALGRYVRRCGARIIGAGDFRNRMREAQMNGERSSERKAELKGEELDDWMRYFGVAPEDDGQR